MGSPKVGELPNVSLDLQSQERTQDHRYRKLISICYWKWKAGKGSNVVKPRTRKPKERKRTQGHFRAILKF